MPTNLPINTIVNVEIVRENSVQQQINLNLVCMMSEDITVIPTSERYRIYDDLSEVLADFADTTPEYKAAQAFFGQNPSPAQLMIASVDIAGSETYPEAIAAAYALKAFYGLTLAEYNQINSIILAIAAYVQANTMLFFWQSSAADILTNVTTDIASLLKAQNYDRTTLWFNDNASATSRLDMAVISMGFARQIGSYNWAFKQLTGVASTSATPSQINIAEGKGVNFYVEVGGTPITQFGYTSSNPQAYIDQIQAVDWLKINIQTSVYNVFIQNSKIPYTDAGVTALANALYSVLRLAVSLQILAPDPKPTVTTVPVSQVLPSDRASRNYPYLSFTAELDDPINKVTINGTVLV